MSDVIRFQYFYRINEKLSKFGSKKFSNPEKLTFSKIIFKLNQNLLDGVGFIPDDVGIKKFKFHRHSNNDLWYEFDYFEIVENLNPPKKELRSISSFISKLEKRKCIYYHIDEGYSEIFKFSKRPTSCPLCGVCIDTTLNTRTLPKMKYQKCRSPNCNYTYIIIEKNKYKSKI